MLVKDLTRVAVFSPDFEGHVNPLLAVVEAFQAKGAVVHVFTGSSKRDKINATGATFHALAELTTASMQTHERFQVSPSAQAKAGIPPHLILPATVQYLQSGLLEVVRDIRPELIVCDMSCPVAVIISHVLSIPVISSCSARFSLGRKLEILREDTCHQLCARWLKDTYNIDYDPAFTMHNFSPFTIVWSIEDFAQGHESHPELHCFGTSLRSKEFEDLILHNAANKRASLLETFKEDTELFSALSRKLESKSAHRLVYCSLGTIFGQESWTGGANRLLQNFADKLFRALGGRQDLTCIFSIGGGHHLEDFDNIPENFVLRQYVPQRIVLSFADVFITHCGNNSFNEALFAGVPMVGIPGFGDQHMNGDTIDSMNLGRAIPSPFAPGHTSTIDHVTSELLEQCVDQVLSSEQIASSVAEIQVKMLAKSNYLHDGHALQEMQLYAQTWKPTQNVIVNEHWSQL